MVLRTDWQNYMIEVAKLVARSWMDPAYREQLLASPIQCLQEAGLEVPDGEEVRFDELASTWRVEQSAATGDGGAIFTIPLPSRPDDVTDEELKAWIESGENILPPFILAPGF